jgi:hypothetical protein
VGNVLPQKQCQQIRHRGQIRGWGGIVSGRKSAYVNGRFLAEIVPENGEVFPPFSAINREVKREQREQKTH